MSPEDQLLVRAAVPDIESAPPAWSGVDWRRLIRLADWHRLTPLVFRYGRRWPQLEIPDDIGQRLRDSYVRTAATNLHLRRELDRVVAEFNQADIPVMVLKGMALLETVYHELGLRPMIDIDVLVPADRFERAGALLERLGYSGFQGFRADAGGSCRGPFVRADGTSGVDLHRHISDDVPRFDPAQLWDRATPSDRGGYLVPHPEDLVVHLSVHFMQHRDTSSHDALGQLADIAWVVRGGGVDWDEVTRRARYTGTAERLFVGLSAVSRLFDGVVPADVLAPLQPDSVTGAMTERFVLRHVLEARRWHHPTYFQRRAKEDFTRTGRPLGRLIPSRATLMLWYGRDGEASYPKLYARRLRRMVAPLVQLRLVGDEQLHRWVEKLDQPGESPS